MIYNNPCGEITVYGDKQIAHLYDALLVAYRAHEAFVKTTEDTNGTAADENVSLSIKAVTRKCFRIEINGLIDFDDDSKEDY